MAKEIKEVKAAKPAKATKTPNPESFFNKFAKPVGKLGLVGALTAGAIGFVNELTKDAIATNIYNQKVEAYKESGSLLEDWTFNGKDKLEANYGLYGEENEAFGIFDINEVSDKDLPATPLIKEVMVYCNESAADDCNATSDDVLGFGFLGERAVDTYGTMSLLMVTDKEGVIVDYNQLGFVTSFSGETAMMDEALEAIVGTEIALADYGTAASIAGASVPASVGSVSSLMAEMASIHGAIASDPHTVVSNIMKTMSDDAPTTIDITATEDMFTVDDVTQVTDITSVQYIVKLNDGGFMFILDYVGYNKRTFIVQVDSTGSDFKWTMNHKYLTSSGFGNDIDAQVFTWLNAVTTVDGITSPGITTGGTDNGYAPGTVNTGPSLDKLVVAMAAAWGGRT